MKWQEMLKSKFKINGIGFKAVPQPTKRDQLIKIGKVLREQDPHFKPDDISKMDHGTADQIYDLFKKQINNQWNTKN